MNKFSEFPFQFMSINEIKRVTSPTLFISGMADTLVPPKMTHDLYTVSVNENKNFWSSFKLHKCCHPSSKSSMIVCRYESILTKNPNQGDKGNNFHLKTFTLLSTTLAAVR